MSWNHFRIFLLQKTHYFLERTHQILTPSNVSAARCRLLLLMWNKKEISELDATLTRVPLTLTFDIESSRSNCISGMDRVPTGPYFREKSLFSIVALPALEKSLLLNIFDRSPGKVLIFNRCVKTWMINIVLRKLRFSKCCGNDVELFGNPSDPLTNHRWRVVWRHLVPAKIPRASFIKFYYVVTLSQSADTWCHVVVVRNLIGPQSRRYTWRTLRKTSSIFVEIRQHT